MIPVQTDIKIPQSWKAFNEHGMLVNAEKYFTFHFDMRLKPKSECWPTTQ